MSGLPTRCSDVFSGRNTGSPSCCETGGDRASILLVRVTSHQGDRENRLQGKVRQEDNSERGKGTICAFAELSLRHVRQVPLPTLSMDGLAVKDQIGMRLEVQVPWRAKEWWPVGRAHL